MGSLLPKVIAGVASLTAGLTQTETNGLSKLGVLNTPRLPNYLDGNHLPSDYPWGNATARHTNPYEETPFTNVVRSYNFSLARGKLAPDGYTKDVMLINGEFPGPLIEANWGDTIQVTVHNDISEPEEGTSLHWHGLLQKATPWYDGVPAVQQCPIPPSKSFTYRFQADLYGTSWYHSHYSAQYSAGLFGPMIIHGPEHVDYDTDVGPVILSDWYHMDYYSVVELITGTKGGISIPTPLAPNSDSNLINGKMFFDCVNVTDGTPCTNNAGISKFRFESGKTHRLRLINSGAEGIQKFSIDDHTMTIIANDFVPIEPYDTKIVSLGIGQRSDVIVRGTGQPTDSFWMRSLVTSCGTANHPEAFAAVYYEDADTDSKPTSEGYAQDPARTCINDDLNQTVPLFSMTPDPDPSVTQNITIAGVFNETHHFTFLMNNQTFRADYNSPVLLLANNDNGSYPYEPEWNVYDYGSNATIRLNLYNDFGAAHPMHLHGHNMFILSEGDGHWDGSITNPHNPQRRDVQTLRANGHLVIQITTDNPGVWPFHCHIAWHVSQGLYVNIMEHPDQIREMHIPPDVTQNCRDWASFTGTHLVDEIDSGL